MARDYGELAYEPITYLYGELGSSIVLLQHTFDFWGEMVTAASATMKIYDSSGTLVRTIADGSITKSAGRVSATTTTLAIGDYRVQTDYGYRPANATLWIDAAGSNHLALARSMIGGQRHLISDSTLIRLYRQALAEDEAHGRLPFRVQLYYLLYISSDNAKLMSWADGSNSQSDPRGLLQLEIKELRDAIKYGTGLEGNRFGILNIPGIIESDREI